MHYNHFIYTGLTALFFVFQGCHRDVTLHDKCSSNSCEAGQLCQEENTDLVCRTLCDENVDCPQAFACLDNLCREGARFDIPEILSVDSNGAQNSNANPVSPFLKDSLVIRGKNLDDSKIRLNESPKNPRQINDNHRETLN